MQQRVSTVLAVLGASLLLLSCGSAGTASGSVGGSIGGTGADGAAADSAAATPVEPGPDVKGRWAMFAFEDPVAISLTQQGEKLTGLGCYGGLPSPSIMVVGDSCKTLSGIAEGRHIQFAFPVLVWEYAADVYVSRDGKRMAGDFHDTADWRSSTSWLRISENDSWMPRSAEPTALSTAVESRVNAYWLEGLVDSRDRPGQLWLTHSSGSAISGTLGSFWETELAWDDTAQTLVAGPVPETSPDLATQLTLHFADRTLLSVDAIFASGEVRTFTAHERL